MDVPRSDFRKICILGEYTQLVFKSFILNFLSNKTLFLLNQDRAFAHTLATTLPMFMEQEIHGMASILGWCCGGELVWGKVTGNGLTNCKPTYHPPPPLPNICLLIPNLWQMPHGGASLCVQMPHNGASERVQNDQPAKQESNNFSQMNVFL